MHIDTQDCVCMQGLAECHGMASGLLHHSETVLTNTASAAPHSMVYALMSEFDSHRTHFATFQVIAQPVLITRLFILSSQVRHVAKATLAVSCPPPPFPSCESINDINTRLAAPI